MTLDCDPKDISLKGFFLGPQAENSEWVRDLLIGLLNDWFAWRKKIFPEDGCAISKVDQQTQEFIEGRKRFSATAREIGPPWRMRSQNSLLFILAICFLRSRSQPSWGT